MEPKNDTTFQDFETLSLRDLQIYDNTTTNSSRSSPRSSSAHDLFEFFTGLTSDPHPTQPDQIVFCGKIIHSDDNNELNEYQKRDYLALVRSPSFRHLEERARYVNPTQSASGRVLESGSSPVKFSSSVKKVNITALTSMSSKSRRRMCIFGPVKFKPEMELSAIKERQGRRRPLPMFPVVEGAMTVANGGGRGKCTHNNHWGLVRTLRCRAHLNSVLAKTFGCVSIH